MKAIKNKDIIKREPEVVPVGEKKLAQKTKSFDQTKPSAKFEQTAIDVNNIAAFKKSKLPEENKQMIVKLHEKMLKHNSTHKMENLKDIVLNIPKFESGYVYFGMHDYPDELTSMDDIIPYIQENVAKIYINESGDIDYEVIPDHLDRFETDADEVDEVVSALILTPLFFELNETVYSAISDPDFFMQIHDKFNVNDSIGVNIDTSSEELEITLPVYNDYIEEAQEKLKPKKQSEPESEPEPTEKKDIDNSNDEPEPAPDTDNEEETDEG